MEQKYLILQQTNPVVSYILKDAIIVICITVLEGL